MHGRQAEQRMLDVVARQDGDRPLGRKLTLQKCRRDGADARERLPIGHAAPGAGAVALREENALGRGFRPMRQPLGEFFRIGLEGARRAQQDRAVRLALDLDACRPEPHRPQRR